MHGIASQQGADASVIDRAPDRILITGASGFVGRHAIPALHARFPKTWLIGTTQHAEAKCAGLDETVAMDLLDPVSVGAAIAKTKPDAVLHLAAQAAVGESFTSPLVTWQVNLLGTLALAEAVLRQRPSAYFLYVSTAEVYGLSFQSGQPLSETALLAPANPYAASKAAADLAIGEMALRGLHAIRLRPFNHIGPGQSEAFVVAAFARQIARIEAGLQSPVIRTGALNRWRDMLDGRDVVSAYVTTVARAHRLDPGTVINLASGIPRCIGDILKALIAEAQTKITIETDPGLLRPTDIETTHGNATCAATLLDWSPKIAWETSLHDVIEYWRNQIGNGRR